MIKFKKAVSDKTRDLVIELYQLGWSLVQLSGKVHLNPTHLSYILRASGVPLRNPCEPNFDPSPEQIKKATARIRANWSEEEHKRRAGMAIEPFTFNSLDSGKFHNGYPVR